MSPDHNGSAHAIRNDVACFSCVVVELLNHRKSRRIGTCLDPPCGRRRSTGLLTVQIIRLDWRFCQSFHCKCFFYFLLLITNRCGETKILLFKTNSLFRSESQYRGQALRWQIVCRGLEDPPIFLKETRARKAQNMLPGEKKGGTSIV